MEIVVKKNVDWSVILQLVGHMSVSFIPMSMPLAVFFSVIYAVSKMNDDAEVMATRSVGFSKEQIFLPFLMTSILLGGVLLSINQQLIPHSQAIFKNQMVKLSSNSLLSEIKPGQFFTEIPKITLFAKEVSGGGTNLERVFMSLDKGDQEQVITASRGKLIIKNPKDENSTELPKIFFHFYNGVLFNGKNQLYKNSDSKYEKINFDEYFFPISTLDNEFSTVSKNSMLINSKLKNKIIDLKKKYSEEKKLDKKNQYFKDLNKAKLELFSRFNGPIQIVLFMLVGFCVGQRNLRKQGDGNSSKGFIFILVYFLFFFFSISQAKKAVISPELAIFFPTVVGLLYGINLFRKSDWLS